MLVVPEEVFEPDDGIWVIRKAVAIEHSRLIQWTAGFIVRYLPRVNEAVLFCFILHRTITGRVDVD